MKKLYIGLFFIIPIIILAQAISGINNNTPSIASVSGINGVTSNEVVTIVNAVVAEGFPVTATNAILHLNDAGTNTTLYNPVLKWSSIWQFNTNAVGDLVITNVGGNKYVKIGTNGTVTMNGALTNLSTSYIPTNTAPTTLTINPTNQFAVSILYTNANQRSLLSGSFYIEGGAGGSIHEIDLWYTNADGIGRRIPCIEHRFNDQNGYIITHPFAILLDPNATWKAETNDPGSVCVLALTNVVNAGL